jgi:hypothetical protein
MIHLVEEGEQYLQFWRNVNVLHGVLQQGHTEEKLQKIYSLFAIQGCHRIVILYRSSKLIN